MTKYQKPGAAQHRQPQQGSGQAAPLDRVALGRQQRDRIEEAVERARRQPRQLEGPRQLEERRVFARQLGVQAGPRRRQQGEHAGQRQRTYHLAARAAQAVAQQRRAARPRATLRRPFLGQMRGGQRDHDGLERVVVDDGRLLAARRILGLGRSHVRRVIAARCDAHVALDAHDAQIGEP